MRIDFFEEFPNQANLSKAKLIDFPSTIYLAAKSAAEFKILESKLKQINPELEPAWWPILPRTYWISPFSDRRELKNLKKELARIKNTKVLIDLEMPIVKVRFWIKNLPFFFKNKRTIEQIFLNSTVFTAETIQSYSKIGSIGVKLLGLAYPMNKFPHRKILMFYSSMVESRKIDRIKKIVIQQFKQYRPNLQLGLGVIAKGIWQTEPILSPKNLDRDLNFAKNLGIQSCVIFRLGGLNNDYLKVIHKYLN